VALVVEQHLLCEDVPAVSEPGIRNMLTAAAATERVGSAVGGATARYIRELTSRRPYVPGLPDPVRVGLPVRLADRSVGVDLEAVVRVARLDDAIAWELAATLAGRNMTEWAVLTLLTASGYPR
jgi:hypothetical protein